MTDALFRIPSRAITYGYVEIQVPSEEGASPEMLAAQYVSYVYAFQKEEQATVDRLAKGLSACLPDEDDPVVDEAVEVLDKGLDGVTEIPVGAVYEHAPDDVVNSMEDAAPWDKKVEPKAKPWEKKAKPTVDVGDDW